MFFAVPEAAAQDNLLAIEIDHPAVSAEGYKAAKVNIKNANAGWLSEDAQCQKSEKFTKPVKAEDGLRFVVQAEKLVPGKNILFLCIDKGADPAEAKQIVITRDDTVPQMQMMPAAGEYGAIPEISITVNPADTVVIYSIGQIPPAFDADGKIKAGEKYREPLRTTGKNVILNALAISPAGVLSKPQKSVYRENARFRGFNGFDIYAGGLYLSTLGSVKDYLPSGIGGVLGARLGLDSFFLPTQTDVAARPFYLPGAWAELHYLRFANGSFSETLLGLILGPEWQLPLTGSRALLFTFALGAGVSQVSVTTPAYSGSGFTTALAAKSGVEYDFGVWSLFAQIRYAYFADQSSPLSGIGAAAGVYWKI